MSKDNPDQLTQTVSLETISQKNKTVHRLEKSLQQREVPMEIQIVKDQTFLLNFWLGHTDNWMWSMKKNGAKTLEQPTVKKSIKPSSPVLAWELFVTVVLLIMALWMQTPATSFNGEQRNLWQQYNPQNHPIYPYLR